MMCRTSFGHCTHILAGASAGAHRSMLHSIVVPEQCTCVTSRSTRQWPNNGQTLLHLGQIDVLNGPLQLAKSHMRHKNLPSLVRRPPKTTFSSETCSSRASRAFPEALTFSLLFPSYSSSHLNLIPISTSKLRLRQKGVRKDLKRS